jgi:hypothetical protein
MHLKTYLLVAMVLVLAMGMGCSGGGSSSGGSSSNTIAGTWNRISGSNSPTQVIFNSDGTGSYSGAPPSSTGATSGSFTWTQTGSTVTLTQGSSTMGTITNVPSPVGNTVSVISGGITSTYNRA